MNKLSDEQIKQKLQEGRNYKRLYFELKDRFDEAQAESKLLEQQLVEQRTYFEAIIEAQNARISELETMVFGRRPGGGKTTAAKVATKVPRSANSYRRPIPPASAITHEKHHAISSCHRCGHELTDKDEVVRYEEDIVLAALTPDVRHKTVTKQTIERGWCSQCGQWSSAKDLRGQMVTLGPVVRSLIVYLVVQADQTYAQTQDLLWQLYRFPVADGEITNVLAARREVYLPVYADTKQRIRAGPSHLDESRYPIQSEQGAGYAHVMASAVTEDAVFKLADSRGKGHSQELVSKDYAQVGITDRYLNYKNLFLPGCHQICWAHLQRTACDLTHLECLPKAKHKHAAQFYQSLATIYALVRTYKTEPFNAANRQVQAELLLEQTKELCQPHALDPKKLADLKAGILEYQDCLFLCLTIDGIPADNNKAERALRKLVIKRKKSFGVKTPKGARTMEVLLSVCHSLYYRDKDNFLPALHALATTEATALA